jgi:hypothetical protein
MEIDPETLRLVDAYKVQSLISAIAVKSYIWDVKSLTCSLR